jgi:hypothetical protein
MAELITEGWAVSVNDGASTLDRKTVAVFPTKEQAEFYATIYRETRKPEISHVFFGTEAF